MSPSTYNRKDEASVNTLRLLAVDMVEKAKSGHPGLPLGAAPLVYALFTRFLKHDPEAPDWPDRDRFVMSPGHGSALLYALLHLSGYDVSMDDLKNFRQARSRTPGHPEFGVTPGVEATTGPLGQGFAMCVGLAMAERIMAHLFNRPGHDIFDHNVYALVSDGDLMEGVAGEAASLAGTLGLNKLICVYDDNHMTIEGSTDLSFTEDVRARFLSYGWQVIVVADGEDLQSLNLAFENAIAEQDKPSLIMARTVLGAGSPKAGKPEAHGEPLGPEALKAARQHYGYGDKEPFFVDERVRNNFLERAKTHTERRKRWEELLDSYGKEWPELRAELDRRLAGLLPDDLEIRLKEALTFPGDKPVATRTAGGQVINALSTMLPELVGGSADLGPSNKTLISAGGSFLPLNPGGRNIHFGVREAAMGAVLNGLALSGGVIPFGGTFLVFSDYLRPAIRLSALMKLRVIHVFTHDSVGVGEDGPTHQPVEHIAALRVIPNLCVMRPADAHETGALWMVALKRKLPSALILSRQNLPVLDPSEYPGVIDGPAKGAYVLKEADGSPEALVLASGSEVSLALKALELVERKENVRVVSVPSFELFEEQTPEYRESVLPAVVTKRLAIEAGVSFGWEKHVGERGVVISNEDFGFSAPAEVIFDELGFSPAKVAEAVNKLLG
ncbi:MAG: transketolase [Deltaproteobacteria bacterium]|jgi:transketolase|nr:transketolase [Deltaproteobacteria bacterium]